MTPTEFLDPVELDVLWLQLRLGDLPFPLQAQSYGATISERDRLRGAARARLRSRGLLDGMRVSGELTRLLGALGRPAAAVDVLALLPGSEPVAAVAAAVGDAAVLAYATRAGVSLRPIRPTALADEILGWLPSIPAGPGRAANLPVADPRGEPALRAVTPDLPVGGGQLRVTRTWPHRQVSVVSWFDTHRGRYLAAHPSPGWLTVAPADRAALRRRLVDLLA